MKHKQIDIKSVGRPSIEVTEEMLIEVERLASLGLNQSQIADSIGISHSTLKRNIANFEPFLKKGHTKLRELISKALIAKVSYGDTTALIFTAKRLNLFQPSLNVKVPTTIDEAVKELAGVYSSYSHGEIGDTQADKLISMLDKFIKAIELSEFEDRLLKLEGNKTK